MKNLIKLMVLFCLLMVSANLFAQSPDLAALNEKFKLMDKDQNGIVSHREMQSYQAKTFRQLDKDKSDSIDVTELKTDDTGIYKLADANGDGKITRDESKTQFNEYFNQMDKDQDNQVSEAEYTDYWKLIYKF